MFQVLSYLWRMVAHNDSWPQTSSWNDLLLATETAIVVVDVWNKSECPTVFERLEAILPAMNNLLNQARGRKVTIIHGPTGAMHPYEGTPARDVMQNIPVIKAGFKHLVVDAEPPWASTGGCECNPERACQRDKREWGKPLAQHPRLLIEDRDFIVDGDTPDELLSVCRYRGIKNLYYVGQALNMCIVGRGYGMEIMKQLGFRVNYSRDLTIAISDWANAWTAMVQVQAFVDQYIGQGLTSREFLEGLE